jgi:cobalt/nickel transport system permease protein
VEGLATAVVVAFVARARAEAMDIGTASTLHNQERSVKPVLVGLLVAAAILGGVASWFASTHPDGLEWSITKVTGKEEFTGKADGVHEKLAAVQSKTAILPDYGFQASPKERVSPDHGGATPESWPSVNAGTSVSGLVGGVLTFTLVGLIGLALNARMKVA